MKTEFFCENITTGERGAASRASIYSSLRWLKKTFPVECRANMSTEQLIEAWNSEIYELRKTHPDAPGIRLYSHLRYGIGLPYHLYLVSGFLFADPTGEMVFTQRLIQSRDRFHPSFMLNPHHDYVSEFLWNRLDNFTTVMNLLQGSEHHYHYASAENGEALHIQKLRLDGSSPERRRKRRFYIYEVIDFDALKCYPHKKFAPSTIEAAQAVAMEDYFFLPGCDHRLGGRPKWRDFSPVRISQTNDKLRGYCKSTLWAVKFPED